MATAIGTAKVTATSGLNVRKGAGTSFGKLGVLSYNQTVSYYSDASGWLKINYNNKVGYISKQYTSTTNGSTSASSSGSAAVSSSSSASSGKVKVTARAGLNVRKGAGTSYGKLGILSYDQTVDYYGESSGWLKIKYNGTTGYISKEYTAPVSSSSSGSSSASSGSSSTATTMYVRVSSTLNVRSGAGTNNPKIGTLSNGSAVVVISSSNGWTKIRYGTGYGWVSSDYLTSSKPAVGSAGIAGAVQGINPHTANFKQYASPWGPKMYSSHGDKGQTYSNSACGPTACASVIAAKANSSVTPYTLGQWALEFGTKYRTYNSGTAHCFVPDVCARYGLSCSRTSVDDGCQALANGKYAVAVMGPGYWTTSGHYITPYGYKDGVIYVDDPGHSSRPNGFKQNKSDFKRQCNGFWVIG